ncbi:MAG TPA: YraN family protein [Terriglobia bacterium]|nr:YraN family protein [Terriglobia bacterium]
MPLLAHLIYSSLLWRERRRAQSSGLEGRHSQGQRGEAAGDATHLETGRHGEMLAYWYLRRMGYTIVARNLRLRSDAGELDLIGWDGPVLSFIEVKTRTSDEAGPPEIAVTPAQQKRIARAAQIYMRRLKKKEVNYRFDIVSVEWKMETGCQVRLIKDAFRPRQS